MEPSTILLSVLGKIANTLLVHLGKSTGKWLLKSDGPVTTAIKNTAADHETIVVTPSLEAWVTSKDFHDLLQTAHSGSELSADAAIVDSFLKTNFYVGDTKETAQVASTILESFFNYLDQELMRSGDGLQFHEVKDRLRSKELSQKVEEVHTNTQRILALQESDKKETEASTEDKAFHKVLDSIRTLVQNGKVLSARHQLEDLKKEIETKQTASRVQFRMYYYLGLCCMEAGEIQPAANHLFKAYSVEPEDTVAICHAALASLLVNNRTKASQLIDSLDFAKYKEGKVAGIAIHIYARLGRVNYILDLMDKELWLSEDVDCARALAQVFISERNYEKAQSILRGVITPDDREKLPYHCMMLAEAIMTPWMLEEKAEKPHPDMLTDEQRKQVEEAHDLFEKAAQVFAGHELTEDRLHAIVNGSTTSILLSRFDEALDMCNVALSLDPKCGLALRNKAILLLNKGQVEDAIKCFESMESQDDKAATQWVLAEAYLNLKGPESAITFMQPLWDDSKTDKSQIDIAGVLTHAYHDIGQNAECDKVLVRLQEQWPSIPESLIVRARIARMREHLTEAENLLDSAMKGIAQDDRPILQISVAMEYYQLQRFDKAAIILDRHIDKAIPSYLLERLVISLLNSKKPIQAFQIAKQVRDGGRAIPSITEIEAMVLEQVYRNLPGARDLYLQLADVEPRDQNHLIQASVIEYQLGNRDSAINLLKRINLNEVWNNATALLTLAELKIFLHDDDPLTYLYRARQIGFDNPDVHLSYFFHFLVAADRTSTDLHPETVQSDLPPLKRTG